MKNRKNKRIARVALVAMLLSIIGPGLFVPKAANAVEFSNAFVRLDRHQVATHTGGTVCVKVAAAAAEEFIDVTFPDDGAGNDFTVGGAASDWDTDVTDTSSWPEDPGGPGAGAYDVLAMPLVGTSATAVTGFTVRFDIGNLTAPNYYCFNWLAGTVTNPSLVTPAAADYQFLTGTGQARIQTLLTGGVAPADVIEETNWSTAIINDDTVHVTAIVPPLFQLIIPDTVDEFQSDLDPDNPVYSDGVTAQIKTNAKSGWIMWVKSQEGGLTSANAGYTIDSGDGGPSTDGTPITLTTDGTTEDYVLSATVDGGLNPGEAVPDPQCDDSAGNGTLVLEPEYDTVAAAGTDGGTLDVDTWHEVATCAGTVLPNTTNGDVVKFTLAASIAYSTPAATDYEDFITIVGAGNF
jgi:hypothetical protein